MLAASCPSVKLLVCVSVCERSAVVSADASAVASAVISVASGSISSVASGSISSVASVLLSSRRCCRRRRRLRSRRSGWRSVHWSTASRVISAVSSSHPSCQSNSLSLTRLGCQPVTHTGRLSLKQPACQSHGWAATHLAHLSIKQLHSQLHGWAVTHTGHLPIKRLGCQSHSLSGNHTTRLSIKHPSCQSISDSSIMWQQLPCHQGNCCLLAAYKVVKDHLQVTVHLKRLLTGLWRITCSLQYISNVSSRTLSVISSPSDSSPANRRSRYGWNHYTCHLTKNLARHMFSEGLSATVVLQHSENQSNNDMNKS